MDQPLHPFRPHDSHSTDPGARGVIYLVTVCEYGGAEVAACRLTCSDEFADGFERGLKMCIDEDTHYVLREEIGECDVADHTAILEPWVEAA
jgi:hypothetical protein